MKKKTDQIDQSFLNDLNQTMTNLVNNLDMIPSKKDQANYLQQEKEIQKSHKKLFGDVHE